MALYLACELADYNPTTGDCSAPYYTEQLPGTVLPPLSLEQGAAVATAILLVWGVAFCFKAAKKALDI